MSYESRHLGRFKARYNSDNDDNELVFQCVRKGVKITPASSTITIYARGNTTAILASTAMTVSGTLNTYAIDTTTVATWPVGVGYRAHIVVVDAAAVTYDDDVYIDVAKTVPQGYVTYDQLLALDDRVRGMDHAGNEDFSELIQSVWDEIQFDIETRTVEGDQMLDSMVVDRARLSVAARFLMLSRILRPKGHSEDATYYEGQYKQKFKQFTAGIPFDVNEDQNEDTEQGLANIVRLVN